MSLKLNSFILLAFCIICAILFAAKQWYESGNLHDADVSTWKTVSHQNKLATASDWILISPRIKAELKSSGSIDSNKVYAEELVACIDSSLEGVNVSFGAADVAASCMVLMGWLK